jgi:Xaa-Pro aminopeptidase
MSHPAAASGVGPFAAQRRQRLSARRPGRVIVVPAGVALTRANDTQYPFRACSAFTWLTGETVEGAVLVMRPTEGGHRATLYVLEYAQPGTEGYFTDHLHGAIWVGGVPTPQQTAEVLELATRPLSELAHDLADCRGAQVDLIGGLDASVDQLLPNGRSDPLVAIIDELRLDKDDWEIRELELACQVTARGFQDVVAEIPRVLDRPGLPGERWLEGTFWRRARLEGNEVGYNSIVAAGAHGTVLHWWRNNGALRSSDLLLADMGVETTALYTADVTRTMPLSGSWSPTQLRVYRAVLEAQQAGIAECRIGNDFLAANRAAISVLADHLHAWGILDVPAAVSCGADPQAPGAGRHRRYTLHGVSHSLGIDVHDCAAAPDDVHRNGKLGPNHVLTVEPGLYFQVNDQTVPPEFRGISVRIEDDIRVTPDGPVNLSGALPREPQELLDWMRWAQANQPQP